MTNTGLTFQKQDQIQSRLHRAALLFAVLLTAALPLAGQVTPKVGPPGVPQLQFVPAQLSLFAGQSGGGCSDTGIPGPAVSANFCTAAATAVDASGNTYIVDTSLNTVYKVDTSGNISVFAGVPVNSITGSYSGDGGQATAAYLSQPSDVAIDGSGNVYIADYGNGRVRKVDATGKISTFVGGGTGYFNGGTGTAVAISPSGITFDPSGNLYVADNPQSLIIKVTSTGAASLFAGYQTALGQQGTAGYNGDNISAVGAELNYPGYVASDLSGNIYIADITNCRIREVAVATGTITTVAGNGTCGNTGDGGAATSAQIRANTVATDLAGDIYFSNGTSIRRVDTSGNILTLAGGGATLPAGYPIPPPQVRRSTAAPSRHGWITMERC